MSTTLERGVDWDYLESQFDGGGHGGDFNNNDGDNSDGWRDEPEGELPYKGLVFGATAGIFPGLAAGAIITSKVDKAMTSHKFISVPGHETALEQGNLNVSARITEAASFVGPILTFIVIGAAVGYKIENFMKKRGQE